MPPPTSPATHTHIPRSQTPPGPPPATVRPPQLHLRPAGPPMRASASALVRARAAVCPWVRGLALTPSLVQWPALVLLTALALVWGMASTLEPRMASTLAAAQTPTRLWVVSSTGPLLVALVVEAATVVGAVTVKGRVVVTMALVVIAPTITSIDVTLTVMIITVAILATAPAATTPVPPRVPAQTDTMVPA